MKRIFYYTHKLLAPSLFAISLLLIINSFITDEPFSKLGLVVAILTLIWIGKKQMELSLKMTSRKLADGKRDHLATTENNLEWNFNSNNKQTTKVDIPKKSHDINFNHLALKQDTNHKKLTKNYPKQFHKHGIEVAQLESNDSYSIANKAIFPN
ncbi:SdpI family protein [Pedobacter aquae]|uniref:SdpI family protein n=1 Tax=Pedobacter aquae TaxID=2605747 RepID=A0A5C0VK77_9SPHI|nr:SdpI family protein [Pedobacter aquae]QEK51334.1 SdpI family protein [Pedobacter aquae]